MDKGERIYVLGSILDFHPGRRSAVQALGDDGGNGDDGATSGGNGDDPIGDVPGRRLQS